MIANLKVQATARYACGWRNNENRVFVFGRPNDARTLLMGCTVADYARSYGIAKIFVPKVAPPSGRIAQKEEQGNCRNDQCREHNKERA